MTYYNKEEILEEFRDALLEESIPFYEEQNLYFMEQMGEDFCKKYTWTNGASKFVLIPRDTTLKYVIKIPYQGHFTKWKEWEEYSCGENAKRPWDYCANEAIRFRIAEEEGLGRCFAKTEFLTCIRGYPIYIQEKCTIFDDIEYEGRSSLAYKKAKAKTTEICEEFDFYQINEDWLTDFRLFYGNDTFTHFIDFIVNNGWDDDLRSENIGYLGNRPVLVDYSGFLG